jgi:hypothetical protein
MESGSFYGGCLSWHLDGNQYPVGFYFIFLMLKQASSFPSQWLDLFK